MLYSASQSLRTPPLMLEIQSRCLYSNSVQVVADGVAGADLLDQYERGEIIMDSDGE